ncbi:MAG: DNA primase [Christensenellaceae bacterium]|jgi:DNA primase
MARFSDEWLQTLLEKSNIVDVIGEYVTLEQRGTRLWARCPWHSERNASFCVSPDKDMFYCFSCKKGGGVINFIMENEKFTYLEAVAFLAERAGMSMPDEIDNEAYQKKKAYRKRLVLLLRDLALFYHQNLYSAAGEEALLYIQQRKIEKQIKPFGLGFALNAYDSAYQFLKEKGYTLQEMVDSGAVRHRDGKIYDFFRNRVMFPVQNVFGDVIGFGGRVLDDSEPKYLNTGETTVFNKRYHLYALNLVRKKQGIKNIILTEGYMDTVSLAGAGIENAVASLGTAFTKEQAKLLKRYTNRVYICYDGDRAGKEAALRAIDILENEGLRVSVIDLPEGMDPDDYIKKYGVEAFRKLGRDALAGMAYKLKRLEENYHMNQQDQVVEYATAAIAQLETLENELEKEQYVKQISKKTGLSHESLFRQLQKGVNKKSESTLTVNTHLLESLEVDEEGKVISLLLERPDLAEQKMLSADIFSNETYQRIYLYISSEIKKGVFPTSAELLSVFNQDGEALSTLLNETIPEGTTAEDYLQTLLRRIQIANCRKKRDALVQEIATAKEEDKMILMEQLTTLNKTLHELNKNFL